MWDVWSPLLRERVRVRALQGRGGGDSLTKECEEMKREDAGLVGVVFIFVIIAVVLNSLGVLLDSAFAVASLGVIAVAMALFVYWYVRFGR